MIEPEILGPVPEEENPLLAQPMIKAPSSDDVQAIRASQDAFEAVMNELITLYRAFDKSKRQAIKDQLKVIRERLMDLGATIGISRMSVDKLFEG